MSRRGRRRVKPLAPRNGVDATRVVLRPGDRPCTVAESLLTAPALSNWTASELRDRARSGEIVDVDGGPVDLDKVVERPVPVYLHRDLPAEHPVPFELSVLHADEDLLAVDKPHFLATMPRGTHVVETALVRMRREFGDDVAPVHRLDRLTAGVLLFTRRREVRAAYQDLFARRRVTKEYRALAPADESLRAGVRVTNRIEKTAGDLRAQVVAGGVNAISDVELQTVRADGLGVYRLRPSTGRTHQLRLHMAGLGTPISGDPLYPVVDRDLAAAPEHGDFSRPLHLLAHSVEFEDPFTGEPRRFTSARPSP